MQKVRFWDPEHWRIRGRYETRWKPMQCECVVDRPNQGLVRCANKATQRLSMAAMALTSKSLAQINKSLDEGRATKKHSALRDASRAERAEFYFDLLCQLAPVVNGWGLFAFMWQRRTNLWRERTKPTTGSKRPSGRSALRCGLSPQRRASRPRPATYPRVAGVSTLASMSKCLAQLNKPSDGDDAT